MTFGVPHEPQKKKEAEKRKRDAEKKRKREAKAAKKAAKEKVKAAKRAEKERAARHARGEWSPRLYDKDEDAPDRCALGRSKAVSGEWSLRLEQPVAKQLGYRLHCRLRGVPACCSVCFISAASCLPGSAGRRLA